MESLRQLWAHRELLWILTARDIKVRYRQSVLGVAWVLFQPLSQMLIFTGVFSGHFSVQGSGIPYPLFVLSGLIPWTMLANTVNAGSSSLVNNSSLLRKIYFPRELLPLSSVASGLVDLGLGLTVLMVLQLAVFRHPPGITIFLLLPAILLESCLVAGLCFFLASINVFLRDIRHIVPSLITLWMFITPVIYPIEKAPRSLQAFAPYNPAAIIVSAFRCALLGSPGPSLEAWLIASLVVVVTLVLGWWTLKQSEAAFAEIV